MVLKLEQHVAQEDIEILITYPQKNEIVERIASFIKSTNTKIQGYSDEGVTLVNASDIYYVESVDNKTIICCEKKNYQVKERLYQVYSKLSSIGFVQISKYCILNSYKLETIKSLSNSHLEAVLSNGIRLNVTRRFLADIKRVLQENE